MVALLVRVSNISYDISPAWHAITCESGNTAQREVSPAFNSGVIHSFKHFYITLNESCVPVSGVCIGGLLGSRHSG